MAPEFSIAARHGEASSSRAPLAKRGTGHDAPFSPAWEGQWQPTRLPHAQKPFPEICLSVGSGKGELPFLSPTFFCNMGTPTSPHFLLLAPGCTRKVFARGSVPPHKAFVQGAVPPLKLTLSQCAFKVLSEFVLTSPFILQQKQHLQGFVYDNKVQVYSFILI